MLQTKSTRYWLIGGERCELCDVAAELIERLLGECMDDTVTYVDVKSSTELYHHFAVKIPVLFDTKRNQFLCWPFDQHSVKEFMRL